MGELSYGDVHVYFEEGNGERTGERRLVRRACNRCYGRGIAVEELERIEVVSVYGTAHAAGEEGKTDCGIDATGPQWWWRT